MQRNISGTDLGKLIANGVVQMQRKLLCGKRAGVSFTQSTRVAATDYGGLGAIQYLVMADNGLVACSACKKIVPATCKWLLYSRQRQIARYMASQIRRFWSTMSNRRLPDSTIRPPPTPGRRGSMRLSRSGAVQRNGCRRRPAFV
jgi:hypothetical protein